jgi:ferrous iron transport protein B
VRVLTAVLLGTENAGKSALVAGLAGRPARASNFAGSTVACERAVVDGVALVDAPGVTAEGDAAALAGVLGDGDVVVLVVAAPRIDGDLAAILPLAAGRRTALVLTHADRIADAQRRAVEAQLRERLAIPVVAVDARAVGAADPVVLDAVRAAAPLPEVPPRVRVGWRIEPPPSALDRRVAGPLLGVGLLIVPAAVAVWLALRLAGVLEGPLEAALAPLEAFAEGLPGVLRDALVGTYGLLTMGPLLVLWAGPVVVAFALLGGIAKASGALDRIGGAVEPLVRWSGLGGRDIVRVILGFGCNVPAVTATRACSLCTRRAVLTAIAFGSACSYQLGATLSVFAVAGRPGLVVPYLGWLGLTALVHTRISAGAERDGLGRLVCRQRTFLVRPRARAVWAEAAGTLRAFARTALPVFALICLVASLLASAGVLERGALALQPLLALLGLPAEATPAVLAAAIRKDGILLLGEPGTLAALSAAQLLGATYLASVLTPCLVTALAIAREQSWRIAGGAPCPAGRDGARRHGGARARPRRAARVAPPRWSDGGAGAPALPRDELRVAAHRRGDPLRRPLRPPEVAPSGAQDELGERPGQVEAGQRLERVVEDRHAVDGGEVEAGEQRLVAQRDGVAGRLVDGVVRPVRLVVGGADGALARHAADAGDPAVADAESSAGAERAQPLRELGGSAPEAGGAQPLATALGRRGGEASEVARPEPAGLDVGALLPQPPRGEEVDPAAVVEDVEGGRGAGVPRADDRDATVAGLGRAVGQRKPPEPAAAVRVQPAGEDHAAGAQGRGVVEAHLPAVVVADEAARPAPADLELGALRDGEGVPLERLDRRRPVGRRAVLRGPPVEGPGVGGAVVHPRGPHPPHADGAGPPGPAGQRGVLGVEQADAAGPQRPGEGRADRDPVGAGADDEDGVHGAPS